AASRVWLKYLRARSHRARRRCSVAPGPIRSRRLRNCNNDNATRRMGCGCRCLPSDSYREAVYATQSGNGRLLLELRDDVIVTPPSEARKTQLEISAREFLGG